MLTGRLKTKAVLDSRHQSAEIRSAVRGECGCGRVGVESRSALIG